MQEKASSNKAKDNHSNKILDNDLEETRRERAKFTEKEKSELFALYDLKLRENRQLNEGEIENIAKEMNKTPKQINAFLRNIQYGLYKRASKETQNDLEKLNKDSEIVST